MALFFILLTVALTATSQVLIKVGVNRLTMDGTGFEAIVRFALGALLNPWVFGGLFAAFCAALSWIVAMSKSELSFAYPFTGVGIVVTLVASGVVLGEAVPLNRWAGVAIVCVGIWVAAQ